MQTAFCLGILLMSRFGSTHAGVGVAPGDGRLLTDFTASTPAFGWYVVNDDVMGGRSEGGFELDSGRLVFAGRTNTDGGGFSSIRTRSVALDLSQYAGIRLAVRGDGRRYTWRLATDARWRGREIGYWAGFETRDGEWTVVDVPFADFVPRFRGTDLGGPALDPSRITGMGLMIYDGQDGPFHLELRRVLAYARAQQSPTNGRRGAGEPPARPEHGTNDHGRKK